MPAKLSFVNSLMEMSSPRNLSFLPTERAEASNVSLPHREIAFFQCFDHLDADGARRADHGHMRFTIHKRACNITAARDMSTRRKRCYTLMGGGQISSSGGEGERLIAFGVLIEPVFPERIQAPTAMDAAQRQNVFRARDGPEHA